MSATDPAEVIRAVLTEAGVEWTEQQEGVFDASLPGTHKLATPIRFRLGPHALTIVAFVCRRPDENHGAVHAWLLERNLRMFGVGFALDPLGDIYLHGRLPHSAITAETLDRLLGSVLTYADESFNIILEMGFADSIRREWRWRTTHGESTANLEAFRIPLGLDEQEPATD